MPRALDPSSSSADVIGDAARAAVHSIADGGQHGLVDGVSQVVTQVVQQPDLLNAAGNNALDGLGGIADHLGDMPVARGVSKVACPAGSLLDFAVAYSDGDSDAMLVAITKTGTSLVPEVGVIAGATVDAAETGAILAGISAENITHVEAGAIRSALDAATNPTGVAVISDHQYYSKDGGQTWFRWTPSGGLFGMLAAIVAALFAVVLAVAPRACSALLDGERSTPPTTSASTTSSARRYDVESSNSTAVSAATVDSDNDALWEASLQQLRMQARTPAEYNALVQQHLKIYGERGVDPCNSGWFEGGCPPSGTKPKIGTPQ